jgi:cyclic nucleotide gated channel alpha 3
MAVIYNLIFVIGRSVFWELENSFYSGWLVLDYLCDLLYIIDMIVRMHEGM